MGELPWEAERRAMLASLRAEVADVPRESNGWAIWRAAEARYVDSDQDWWEIAWLPGEAERDEFRRKPSEAEVAAVRDWLKQNDAVYAAYKAGIEAEHFQVFLESSTSVPGLSFSARLREDAITRADLAYFDGRPDAAIDALAWTLRGGLRFRQGGYGLVTQLVASGMQASSAERLIDHLAAGRQSETALRFALRALVESGADWPVHEHLRLMLQGESASFRDMIADVLAEMESDAFQAEVEKQLALARETREVLSDQLDSSHDPNTEMIMDAMFGGYERLMLASRMARRVEAAGQPVELFDKAKTIRARESLIAFQSVMYDDSYERGQWDRAYLDRFRTEYWFATEPVFKKMQKRLEDSDPLSQFELAYWSGTLDNLIGRWQYEESIRPTFQTFQITRRYVNTLRLATVATGLRLHEAKHGELPESLDELTKVGVPARALVDPFGDGKAHFGYDRAAAKVWSRGENGLDDGGKAEQVMGVFDADVMIRLSR